MNYSEINKLNVLKHFTVNMTNLTKTCFRRQIQQIPAFTHSRQSRTSLRRLQAIKIFQHHRASSEPVKLIRHHRASTADPSADKLDQATSSANHSMDDVELLDDPENYKDQLGDEQDEVEIMSEVEIVREVEKEDKRSGSTSSDDEEAARKDMQEIIQQITASFEKKMAKRRQKRKRLAKEKEDGSDKKKDK